MAARLIWRRAMAISCFMLAVRWLADRPGFDADAGRAWRGYCFVVSAAPPRSAFSVTTRISTIARIKRPGIAVMIAVSQCMPSKYALIRWRKRVQFRQR